MKYVVREMKYVVHDMNYVVHDMKYEELFVFHLMHNVIKPIPSSLGFPLHWRGNPRVDLVTTWPETSCQFEWSWL